MMYREISFALHVNDVTLFQIYRKLYTTVKCTIMYTVEYGGGGVFLFYLWGCIEEFD